MDRFNQFNIEDYLQSIILIHKKGEIYFFEKKTFVYDILQNISKNVHVHVYYIV